MIFDTHAHYDAEQFDTDREELLGAMEAGGVGTIVDAGSTLESWDKILELTERYPFIYGAIGVHPDEVGTLDEAGMERMAELLDREKIVAAGEIGLDYHYDLSPRDAQREVFERQLDLALELDMPVQLHIREAHGEAMELMRRRHASGTLPRGIMHCFSGSWELAKVYLSFGYYISLSGVITFKNANKLLDVAKNTPLDRLLVETDCPYMAPVPMRGQRNEPSFVQYTFARVAELRGEDPETLAEQLWENTARANS